jgi:ADP-dependent phosphofructokinase/glucokinase
MTSHVVLGLGGCVDYEVRLSSPTLEQLVGEYGIRDAELTSATAVTNERELVISVLAYIKEGAGGEHFAGSSDALRAFAARFPRRVALGGTSVRAAIAMSRLGVPSTLHLVSVNDFIRHLLPANCEYISSGRQDELYPHLIVQYDKDIRVRVDDIDIHAPFPNRLIYVNDPASEALLLSDELGSLLRDAHVFLISAFNAVRDREVLDERLATLRSHMRQLPPEAVIYYEDAAFHEPDLNHRVRNSLLPVIDIYGLNEDEMQSHLGRAVDLLSVTDVECGLKQLRTLIPAPTLVVHTKYWSAAFGERAGDYAGPLNGGIMIASTRYSHGDDYTEEQLESMRSRPRRREASEFAAALEARMGDVVRCVPGFDLDVAEPTTIGLGDTFVGGFLAAVAQKEAASWT